MNTFLFLFFMSAERMLSIQAIRVQNGGYFRCFTTNCVRPVFLIVDISFRSRSLCLAAAREGKAATEASLFFFSSLVS